jgi:hypothetical protein
MNIRVKSSPEPSGAEEHILVEYGEEPGEPTEHNREQPLRLPDGLAASYV